MSPTIGTIASLLFLAAGCTASEEPSVCSLAQEHVAECMGTSSSQSLQTCDGDAATAAESVLSLDCQQLGAAAKADSPLCSATLDWLGLCPHNPTELGGDFCVTQANGCTYGGCTWFHIDCGQGPVATILDAGSTDATIAAMRQFMTSRHYVSIGEFALEVGTSYVFRRDRLPAASEVCLAAEVVAGSTIVSDRMSHMEWKCSTSNVLSKLDSSRDAFVSYMTGNGYSLAADFSKPITAQTINGTRSVTKLVFAR